MKCGYRATAWILVTVISIIVILLTVFDEMVFMKYLDSNETQIIEPQIVSSNHNTPSPKIIINKTRMKVSDDECRDHIANYSMHHHFAMYCEAMIFRDIKLITLIPAKVGSSVFKFGIFKLLRAYLPSNPEGRRVRSIINKDIPSICAKQIPFNPRNETAMRLYKEHTTKYFCDSSYDKYMIIRDPLTRILSGYLDKCMEHYDNIKNKTWSHKYWHSPCKPYLLSIGIDIDYWRIRSNRVKYDRLSMEERKEMSKLNNFKSFIEWILKFEDKSRIDNHFKNLFYFANMEYFKLNWKIFDVHDINGWDMILHKLLLNNEEFYGIWERIKKQLNMTSYESNNIVGNYRKKRMKNESYIPLDPHTTHSSQKVLVFYNDTDTLKLTMDYVWKDYLVFDIKLPQWICNIISVHHDNREKLTEYFVNKFYAKLHLLPTCIT